MNDSLIIDGLTIQVHRSSLRRTSGLIVERDGTVVVAVPERLAEDEIRNYIESKLLLLHTALAKKERSLRNQSPKEYITGEGFYYLGRKFRLKIVDDSSHSSVRLMNGRFLLSRSSVSEGRELFVQWYTMRAQDWIPDRVSRLQRRVGVTPLAVNIRDLAYRWGSCTRQGKLNFHWRTMLLPPERLDYLILHELCHIHVSDHSQEFYNHLRCASPNYMDHEAWLRTNGDFYKI